MSEDASYYDLNATPEVVNECRAFVKWEPQPEIVWTLEDLQFLYACGVSCE